MKNRKRNITLSLILIGQLLIPLIFFCNEKFILNNSETETFEVESLKVNLKKRSVSVEIKSATAGIEDHKEERFYDGLARGTRVTAYEVKTYVNTKYLKLVPRETFVGENIIVNDICRVDIKDMPYNYLVGDELSEIHRSMNGDNQLHIEADINYLNGACVVRNIYINGLDYMDYINDNYYDLLILKDDTVEDEGINEKEVEEE